MKCKHCGEEIDNDSVFCEFCGEKIETEEDRERKRAQLKAQGWVDLGLPSGTLWKDTNEEGFYTFSKAVDKFGSSLPTKQQFDELIKSCKWIYQGKDYRIVGPNGESIVLPAEGFRAEVGWVVHKNDGHYWSLTPCGHGNAWYLEFDSAGVHTVNLEGFLGAGLSIHLIRNDEKKPANKTLGKKQLEKLDKESSGCCYIATAVYGSYDCPEVWTLRRYRDNVLDNSWYGRTFIRMYYAVSPTIVKWFGHTEWFRKLFHKPLNKWVKKLNEQGFENTPYKDKF